MKINLEGIREQYPAPSSAKGCKPGVSLGAGGLYCVGGALCLTLDSRNILASFPDQYELMVALEKANPSLDGDDASWYAYQIITANDKELFDTAWKLLGEALEYTGDGSQKEEWEPLLTA